MNVEPSGRRRRWSSRELLLGTLLLFTVPIGAAGPVLWLAGRFAPLADVIRAGQIVFLLSPVLLFAATALYARRRAKAARRQIDNRRAERWPQPSGPPIEQIAADLQRLLWQHDTLMRSDDMTARAVRLRAMEASISDRATQAARALGVSYPDRPALGGYDRSQLRVLLQALAAEGLVLPPAVTLLAPDGRF
jgi:hypothetical protein